jgi:ABC-type amino acid transport substrate-binding protein
MRGLKNLLVWLALIGMMSVTGPARGDTLDDIRKSGTIRVGMGLMGVKPYIWQNPDGTYAGFENEMLKYVLNKIGVPKYEYVISEWPTMIPGLKAKRWDILWTGMAVTQERIQGGGINYSRPYFLIYDYVLVLKGSPVKGADDLKGKTVGTMLGTMDSVVAHSLGNRGITVEVKDFNSMGEAFMALRNRQVDAAILDQGTYIGQKEEMPDLEAVGEPLFYLPKPEWAQAEAKADYRLGALAVGVRREDTGLLEAINAALKAMDEDGTRQRILTKYGLWDKAQGQLFK